MSSSYDLDSSSYNWGIVDTAHEHFPYMMVDKGNNKAMQVGVGGEFNNHCFHNITSYYRNAFISRNEYHMVLILPPYFFVCIESFYPHYC